jgi:hypothetical protein
VVPDRGGVLVIDDPLSLLSLGLWLFAAGMWPVGFLFGACSACCRQDECPWLIEFDRCLRVSHVGSTPAVGGDCQILPVRAGTGDAEFMTGGLIQIHHVQSQIRISVRISLSAAGASRTPVGETRTQTWRFNRATPTNPPATAYDVLGPPWHLQVDLSVTGVATDEESGVATSLETDEHGQPKLVLQVNQWTANITRDEVVTLFPAGLQRWGAGLVGVQSFRLTSTSVSATRVSGGDFAGWTVSKLSGLAIEERTFAVRINGALCVSAGGGNVTQRVILDDVVAVGFLRGDQDLRVSALSAERDLRIAPNNILCGLPRDLVGAGVAAGVYPETISVTAPEEFSSQPEYCGDPVSFTLKPSASASSLSTECPVAWTSNGRFYGRSCSGGFSTLLFGTQPSDFWAGLTLLWNLENGPYRTSFIGSTPGAGGSISDIGWTYLLDASGESDSRTEPATFCAAGRGLVGGHACGPNEIEVQFNETLDIGTWQQTGFEPQSVICGPPNVRVDQVNISGVATLVPRPDLIGNVFGEGRAGLDPPLGTRCPIIYGLRLFGGVDDALVFTFSAPPNNSIWTLRVTAFCSVPSDGCSPPGAATVQVRFIVDVSRPFGDSFFSASLTGEILRSRWATPSGAAGCTEDGDPHASDFEVPQEITLNEASRLVCGPWTPNPVPAEGGVISRVCEITGDGGDSVTETDTVPASLSRLPKTLGRYPKGYGEADQITQLGSCRLLALSDLNAASRAAVPQTVLVSPSRGQCFSYIPTFGVSGNAFEATLCLGDSSNASSIPCGNCQPSVSVVSGEQYASVAYLSSGDRAGVIEVVALTTWLGGQGVTFTVNCGGDTITQTIRRADTAPTPPRNLTVFRGPCSQAALQWEASEWDGGQPITGYSVQFRRIGVSAYTTFATVSPTTFSATITGLLRVGYQFRVLAVNSVGSSAQSNVVAEGFALGAPTDLTLTRDPCDAVQLSWTAPTQGECVVVANYRLEYRVGISGTFLVFGTVAGTETTGVITGLDPTLRYQFRVASINEADAVAFSGTITSGTSPAAPTEVVASLGTNLGEVNLAWAAAEQPCFPNTGYLVQIRPDTTSTWSDGPSVVGKSATVTGLPPATYFFRARATNSIGNGGFSAQSNSVTIPEPE